MTVMSDVKSPSGPRPTPPMQQPGDEPPPYSGAPAAAPATPAAGASSRVKVPGMPNLPFSEYTPASASVSSDGTIVTIPDPVLSSSPSSLVAFIRAQAALPPYLVMRVQGFSYSTRTDFDVRINLLRYLLWDGASSGREGLNYVVLNKENLPEDVQARLGRREITMPLLAQQYCADRNTNKIFTLERKVSNLDESILAARVTQCLSELKYKGSVEVTFPIRNQKVSIAPSGTILDKFVGFFSKPREYAAVEAVWPFATAAPPPPSQHENKNPERDFAVRSEEGLWHDWKPAFERAVLQGRVGWVSIEDIIETKMGTPGPKYRYTEWGSMGYQMES